MKKILLLAVSLAALAGCSLPPISDPSPGFPPPMTSSSGGGSNWVKDTSPPGTYSPDKSGSGGADSTHTTYNPGGTAPGDSGTSKSGGFAPPTQSAPDPSQPTGQPPAVNH